MLINFLFFNWHRKLQLCWVFFLCCQLILFLCVKESTIKIKVFVSNCSIVSYFFSICFAFSKLCNFLAPYTVLYQSDFDFWNKYQQKIRSFVTVFWTLKKIICFWFSTIISKLFHQASTIKFRCKIQLPYKLDK